jgi:cytochrome oxidase assembly protein ShyY1
VTSFPSPTELSAALAGGVAGEAMGAVRLEPRVLLMDAAEPAGYRRDWQPFARGPEQNYSYALQWWSFGVLLLVLYGVLNTKRKDDA